MRLEFAPRGELEAIERPAPEPGALDIERPDMVTLSLSRGKPGGVHGAGRQMRSGRGWSSASHDAAILHPGRRSGDMATRVGSAEITGARRRSVDAVGDLRAPQGCRVRCWPPRLMCWPFTKELCEATVTACGLRA